ncbi:MAG: FAD-dependent oxidoreductase [Deltaproteobacteria bacterium]|nr:FAD-dependent oxidoreductase [Deltaproteobacteria bacterium]
MKRTKDRLHRVMVIGATPAGIAAVNKLGELGVPVTLVDPDPDLNEKLAREEWRLPSGVALNYAHRSGLLRILRNPSIRLIAPAEVLSVKNTAEGFSARIRSRSVYVDETRCTLCGACAKVCPISMPDGSKPLAYAGRMSLPGRARIEKRNEPPCKQGCPLGVNAQAYLALAKAGRHAEALSVVRRDNVLPGICGRVCSHPCEKDCRRAEIDAPLTIRAIKRFLADWEISHPQDDPCAFEPFRGQKVAVIGSGPAGLAAAADLAGLGYEVTILEREKEAGGLLRYAIGPYRLPREILDREITRIEAMGVKIETGRGLDFKKDLTALAKKYDAVLLAVGSWTDRKLGMPGEDLKGVEGAVFFLSKVHRKEISSLPGKTAIIGDGNSAFDVARTVKRLGGDPTIISWFPADMIPADEDEIRAAAEEGIPIIFKTRVVEFEGRGGKLAGLVCRATRPGKPDANGIAWPVTVPDSKPLDIPFDRAIVAIGQAGPFFGTDEKPGVGVNQAGYIEADAHKTSAGKVYAAGDSVTGPSTVVHAMASGRSAARAIHRDLSGEDVFPRAVRPTDRNFAPIGADLPSLSRAVEPERRANTRVADFGEAVLGLSEAQAVSEAERCLQCGGCCECLLCETACEAAGAVVHDAPDTETKEHAGVVILADPDLAPSLKGDDVIRAYGPPAAKSDVHAMMLRGFAAAGQAMTLLAETSERPRGRGGMVAAADTGLDPEIRVGVFVCRCNDSLGWNGELSEFVENLGQNPDVVHAETISCACSPEGAAGIVRTIKRKGITRAVMASCACCPLDFVCSACTDQRSRLKHGLFKGTGVSRSMVETVNIRGEALSLLAVNPETALGRFRGLLTRAIRRVKRVKALPVPHRSYNFTVAVIGSTEAAVQAADTLALSGHEVFVFSNDESPELAEFANVHRFPESGVVSLSGTVGDFRVLLSTETGQRTVHAGAVILGTEDDSAISYTPHEGIPGRIVESALQKAGEAGIPFLFPGGTSVAGLFLADCMGLKVSERKKGLAAAVCAASVMPRGPRQSKGYTVSVDAERCRGCGACVAVCPYQAVTLERNGNGGYSARVDEALCKGCGNCISLCPPSAMDSPYRSRAYLGRILEEVLS